MKKLIYSLLLFILFSCGPKIYKSADFSNALTKHKTVAILPAEVNIQLRPNQAKNLSAEQIQDMANKTAIDIQEKMYGWFLRRGDKYDYTVTFQDVTRTNARLKEAGIKYFDLKTTVRAKLANILEVDAIMQD